MRLFRAQLWFVAGKDTTGVGNLQEECGLLRTLELGENDSSACVGLFYPR